MIRGSHFCFCFFTALIVCAKSEGESKFKIISATATDSMKNHALGTALMAFEANSDPNTIASKLAEEFNQVYGRHWFCLVGPQGFVSHFDAANNTLIWFTYNNIQIILFKPTEMTPTEIISEARRLDRLNISIIRSEMAEPMKENAILVTTLAVKSFNDFQAIAYNITATFDTLYGQFWHCFTGPKASQASVRYISGSYLSFTVGDLQLLLFKTNQPSLSEDQTSVIVRTRTSSVSSVENIVGVDAATKDGIIAIAKQGINQSSTYADLALYVRNTVAPKYGAGVWSVTVSTVNHSTESFNIVTKKLISFHIGEIRFLIYQQ